MRFNNNEFPYDKSISRTYINKIISVNYFTSLILLWLISVFWKINMFILEGL